MTSHRIRSGLSLRAVARPRRPFSAAIASYCLYWRRASIFRRMSGSSSITRIFFIVHLKEWQSYDYGCAFPQFAFDLKIAMMQLNAPPYQQQTQAGAGSISDVGPTMKSGEKLSLIFFRNPDALIANDTSGIRCLSFNG